MAKKTIDVGGGFSVRFDQRAKGTDSRLMIGVVFKDGAEVGGFQNDGRGGSTIMAERRNAGGDKSFVKAFEAMVDAAEPAGHDFGRTRDERAGLVLHFADIIGYSRAAAGMTFADFLKVWLAP